MCWSFLRIKAKHTIGTAKEQQDQLTQSSKTRPGRPRAALRLRPAHRLQEGAKDVADRLCLSGWAVQTVEQLPLEHVLAESLQMAAVPNDGLA